MTFILAILSENNSTVAYTLAVSKNAAYKNTKSMTTFERHKLYEQFLQSYLTGRTVKIVMLCLIISCP